MKAVFLYSLIPSDAVPEDKTDIWKGLADKVGSLACCFNSTIRRTKVRRLPHPVPCVKPAREHGGQLHNPKPCDGLSSYLQSGRHAAARRKGVATDQVVLILEVARFLEAIAATKGSVEAQLSLSQCVGWRGCAQR